jgi:hypothetical protein
MKYELDTFENIQVAESYTKKDSSATIRIYYLTVINTTVCNLVKYTPNSFNGLPGHSLTDISFKTALDIIEKLQELGVY